MNAAVVEISVGVVYIIVGSLHHYAMRTFIFLFICFYWSTTLEHMVEFYFLIYRLFTFLHEGQC